MLWQALIIYLSLVLHSLLWWLFLQQPQLFGYWFSLFLVIILVVNLVLTGSRPRHLRFWLQASLPLTLSLAVWGFMLFWEVASVRYLVAIINVIFLGIWWETLFSAVSSEKQKIVSIYFGWLSIFLFFITAYNVEILLGWPFWLISLLVSLFLWWQFFQMFWHWQLSTVKIWLYSLVLTLVFVELFWSFMFWPVGVYLSSLLLAAGYYLIVGLLALITVDKKLTWSEIKYKVIIFLVIIISSLLVAQWR
ncbi:MAG: hypothetical protein WCW02_04360 [Candidatus Buchananbacteria bacterium]